MNTICYSPESYDHEISARTNGVWSPQDVAIARGKYDADGWPALKMNDPEADFNSLLSHQRKLTNDRQKKIKSAIKSSAQSYRELNQAYAGENRKRLDRINMVVQEFSTVISLHIKQEGGSRLEWCNGFIDSQGNKKGGQFSLFEDVYRRISSAYSKDMATLNTLKTYKQKAEERIQNSNNPQVTQTAKAQLSQIEDAISKTEYRVSELAKVLDNWSAIVPFARVILKQHEGLKLGNNSEYADVADIEDYLLNDFATLLDPEASPKESYQEINELTSSFSRLGAFVRRVLSTAKVRKANGEVDKDDLGYDRCVNPIVAHQTIMDFAYTAVNSEDFMSLITEKAKSIPWLNDVIEQIKDNPTAITQFWQSFNKDWIYYGEASIKNVSNGLMSVRTWIKNKFVNNRSRRYIAAARKGQTLSDRSENTIYDETGRVNWKNYAKVRKLVQDHLLTRRNPDPNSIDSNPEIWKDDYTMGERAQIICDILQPLGINVSLSQAEHLLNSRSKYSFINAVTELFKNGFDYALRRKVGDQYFTEWLLDNIDNPNLVDNVNRELNNSTNLKRIGGILSVQRAGSRESYLTPKLNKLFEYVGETDSSIRERAVTYKNNKNKTVTFFSHVLPSYLGTFMRRIERYANYSDTLKTYLDNKYGISSQFKDSNGKWYNPFLQELYDSNPRDSKSLARNIQVARFLGESRNPFENFTSRQHLVTMISQYSFAENKDDGNGHMYANYPVFVLGDSGVCKTIRGKRYSEEEVIEHMYRLYLSEVARQKQTVAANTKLEESGYKKFKNMSDRVGEFTVLPFLNKHLDEINDIRGKQDEEEKIKEIIKDELNIGFDKFKKDAAYLGAYETAGTGNDIKSKWFSEEINKMGGIQSGQTLESTLDELLKDFYINTKLATMCQVQMLTIDPGFYKDVKDLQKRYKEEHAPGESLDVTAKEDDGSYVFEKEGEEPANRKCIYFEEEKRNADDTNPEFMQAIKANRSEFERRSGVNAYERTLNDYRKNKFTDGQGYVLIDNYRKILKAAGKWTEEMQEAYDAIKDLEARYFDKETKTYREIPEAELQKVANMAVVFQPLKPFTFTFEKYPLNDNDCMLVPVQHKYSEMVLIPALMRPSMLRDLALEMQDQHIDMACSTECVKVGNFGATSLKNMQTRDDVARAVSNAYVHKINYEDYRIQTNVPNHINENRLFGTQARKLIMAGVQMASDRYANYIGGQKVTIGSGMEQVTLTGRNLINFYNGLIVANMLESWQKFESEISDPEILSEILEQGIINNDRESWDNLYAYAVEQIDGVKDFHVPLSEGGTVHDSSAFLFSLFRKSVNKQRIKGGSAVQASAMGLTGYEEDGGLSYVCCDENGNIIRSSDSDYEQRKNDITNILYAEIEVPFDLSITKNGKQVALEYEKYCNADGTLKTDSDGKPLIEKEYPGILDRVCYRIPTEKPYSMINAKIVRFSHPTEGGTIKVPSQGTTIAGFDFDIDKLYFIAKEFVTETDYENKALDDIWERDETKTKKEAIWEQVWEDNEHIFNELQVYRDKLRKNAENLSPAERRQKSAYELGQAHLNAYWKDAVPSYNKAELFQNAADKLGIETNKERNVSEYDFNKPPMENSRAARNNMIMHLMQQRLQDRETFVDRYTPGGFQNSSYAARQMRELLNGNYDNFMTGNKVSLNKLTEYLENEDNYNNDPEGVSDYSDPMTIIRYNQQNQVAGKLIGIFANQNANYAFSTLMKTFKLKNGFDICDHKDFTDLIHSPVGRDSSRTVAEFLAASVDAVKDPVLNFLNLNTHTADSGALLARLGYNTVEIGLFFNQPIIKEVCELADNEGYSLETAIFHIKSKYNVELAKHPGAISNKSCSAQSLADSIVNNRKFREENQSLSGSYFKQQLDVLDMFDTVRKAAGEVGQFVTATKFTASNSVGSTFGDMYEQQMRVSKYLSDLANDVRDDSDKKSPRLTEIEVTELFKSPLLDVNLDTSPNDYYREVVCYGGLGNPFAYEQCMYDLNKKCVAALNRFFPYDTQPYRDARQLAAVLTKKQAIDAETINTIHDDLFVYLINQQENNADSPGDFNPNYPVELSPQEQELYEEIYGIKYNPIVSPMTMRDYYNTMFPSSFVDILAADPKLKDFAILDYIVEDVASNKTILKISEVSGLKAREKDLIKDSWADLYKYNPTLAKDLFLYCYHRTGFGFNPMSFMHLAPVALKEEVKVGETSYLDFVRKVNKGDYSINTTQFMQAFIRNHFDNYRFVYTVKYGEPGSLNQKLKTAALSGSTTPNQEFDVNLGTLTNNNGDVDTSILITGDPLTKDDENKTSFMPVIAIPYGSGYVYYMADGNLENGRFNIGLGTSIKYRQIGRLGTTNKSLCYDFSLISSSSQANDYNFEEEEEHLESPSRDDDNEPAPTLITPTVASLIGDIHREIKTAVLANYISPQQAEQMRKALIGVSLEDLQDTLNALRAEREANNQPLLDDRGQPICATN